MSDASTLLPGAFVGQAVTEPDVPSFHVSTNLGTENRVPNAYEHVSDEVLLFDIGRGSRDALALLFRRYRQTVFHVALRILRNTDDAEDLCQDVFIYLSRKAGIFDPHKGKASSWIIQISYHRAFNRKRYLSIRQNGDLQAPLDRYAGPGQIWSIADEITAKKLLNQLREQVSEEQRRTLELHLFEGYSLREIAEQSGLTLGCVRNRYYRALERLRTCVFSPKPPR